MKAAELTGSALNWAVAIALGYADVQITGYQDENEPDECFFSPAKLDSFGNEVCGGGMRWEPSTNWAQGGPIIERSHIELRNQTCFSGGWEAWKWMDEKQNYLIIGKRSAYCQTPLIAAMRCYVISKLGEEVDVPDDLIERRKGPV